LVPIGEKRLKTGGAFVTTPHRLIYEDQSLRLVFPNAGNHRSMPTSLMVTADFLTIVSVSALAEYVDVKAAAAESRRLLTELKLQGFDYAHEDPAKYIYPKFYLARHNIFARPRPPQTVGSFEEMEAVFLNSQVYLEEFLVFSLRKAQVEARLRVTNMRRRHTENRISATGPILSVQDRADQEARMLNRETLEKERAYYLEVSIARPIGYGAR
jgi:hypothetical protein